MALRRALAGDQVHLVVAVQVHLVSPTANLLALEKLVGDVRVASRRDERWEPVQPGYDAILDLARRHLTGPADDHRHAEAAFEGCSFTPSKRGLATIGPGEVLGAVIRAERQDGVVIEAVVLDVLHDRADDVVELRHPSFLFGPAVLRRAHRFIFLREMRNDVHPGRVEPEEERLVTCPCAVEELECICEDLIIHRLHAFRTELPRILDLLFPDLAPARLHGGIVHVRRPGMDHVSRADLVPKVLWVVGMARVLHRVEVIQIAEEFVEAMHRGQELIQVAKVILAELPGGIAHGLERLGEGDCLVRETDRRASLADRGHSGANRQFTGDEVRSTRRTACLGVVVGEPHAFGSHPVQIRRPARHHTLVVGADVEPADVVTHDEDDVRLLLLGRRRTGDPC